MAIDRDLLKQLVDLVDGDGWQMADLLADQFGADQYGDHGEKGTSNTGLYGELEDYQTEAAAEYGVDLQAETMRKYRATALAWPHGTRVPCASFAAHQMLRGKDREEQMRSCLKEMKREGKKALSQRMVTRYKTAGKPPKPAPPWEMQVARAVDSLARRLTLGNVVYKGDDWQNAKAATPRRRRIVADALRAALIKIESAES